MIDELKSKIEEIKEKEKRLNIASQTISILNPLMKDVELSLQEKVQSNAISILQETISKVGNDIVNKIDYKEILSRLDSIQLDGKNSEILQEVKNLVTNINNLSRNTIYNQNTLIEEFDKSINKIVNILSRSDEIPKATEYKRLNDKITQVIETYSNYTLTYKWIYDSQGYLVKVTTTKDEIT